MRYVRLSGALPPEIAPEVFRVLADSDHVVEARLLDWNLGDSESVTALYAIDGDCEAAREALLAAPEAVAASASVSDGRAGDGAGSGCLLIRLDRTTTPLMEQVFTLLSTPGLVVLKPVVYRDGEVDARLVGEDDVLQAVVDRLPESVDREIRRIGPSGSLPVPETAARSLSDRQREAVEAALELGYYDHPRRGTHEDVAELLGCAPSTASEHLQKAEAKLVRTAFASRNP